MESPVEFVLPLLDQTARADNQTALQVASGNQLLNEQPRHDGFARSWIVGEQEP